MMGVRRVEAAKELLLEAPRVHLRPLAGAGPTPGAAAIPVEAGHLLLRLAHAGDEPSYLRAAIVRGQSQAVDDGLGPGGHLQLRAVDADPRMTTAVQEIPREVAQGGRGQPRQLGVVAAGKLLVALRLGEAEVLVGQ